MNTVDFKTFRLIIKGRVQNVGFRHWFSDLAISLGLNGYVQNKESKDEVEAIVQGDMKSILSISKRHNIPIIEDNCEAVGGTYNKKFLGTLGEIGVMSFDFAKIITTGEGGAILTNKKKLYNFCKEYHDHGHQNNLKYARGNDSSKIAGFNFRITEMQAAIGKVQLKYLDEDNDRRNEIAHIYEKSVTNLENIS